MTILVKVHESYRKIVAVCDADLLGKYFDEGNRQLDVKKDFFNGEEKTEQEVVEILQTARKEDSTFNIIGKKSINAALKAGIIDKKGIMKLKSIPYALGLL